MEFIQENVGTSAVDQVTSHGEIRNPAMAGTAGGSASFSDEDSQNHCEINARAQDDESEPLLSNKNHPARPRSRMTGSKTPGLDQSVQDFKAQEDRDPEKLNDDVKVSLFCKYSF